LVAHAGGGGDDGNDTLHIRNCFTVAFAPAVFPKTDGSHAPVYCTIDVASLAVTSFSFPLIEVSKPVFALPSSDGKLLTKLF
jgi:hypothetical protein